MEEYTLKQLNEIYNLELEKVTKEIKNNNAKIVLLQFPDGIKHYATTIVDYLETKTKSKFLIWIGSCYGACDTPTGLEKIRPKIDLVIQFGHNSLMPSYL